MYEWKKKVHEWWLCWYLNSFTDVPFRLGRYVERNESSMSCKWKWRFLWRQHHCVHLCWPISLSFFGAQISFDAAENSPSFNKKAPRKHHVPMAGLTLYCLLLIGPQVEQLRVIKWLCLTLVIFLYLEGQETYLRSFSILLGAKASHLYIHHPNRV